MALTSCHLLGPSLGRTVLLQPGCKENVMRPVRGIGCGGELILLYQFSEPVSIPQANN